MKLCCGWVKVLKSSSSNVDTMTYTFRDITTNFRVLPTLSFVKFAWYALMRFNFKKMWHVTREIKKVNIPYYKQIYTATFNLLE